MSTYAQFHRRSLEDKEGFWSEQAGLIDWHKPFQRTLDFSRPPFAKWFVGGETNLCHNALDRHLADRAEQKALVWISTEVDKQASYTYRELHAEVQRVAAMLLELGVKRGDRVIIYMPMIPEASFAMLACARIGGVWRFCRGQSCDADRRCHAALADHRGRRQPHGQGDFVQGIGRRIDPLGAEPA